MDEEVKSTYTQEWDWVKKHSRPVAISGLSGLTATFGAWAHGAHSNEGWDRTHLTGHEQQAAVRAEDDEYKTDLGLVAIFGTADILVAAYGAINYIRREREDPDEK